MSFSPIDHTREGERRQPPLIQDPVRLGQQRSHVFTVWLFAGRESLVELVCLRLNHRVLDVFRNDRSRGLGSVLDISICDRLSGNFWGLKSMRDRTWQFG